LEIRSSSNPTNPDSDYKQKSHGNFSPGDFIYSNLKSTIANL
jgi:hypothetical protein